MAFARWQRTITTDRGIILPGASVEVRRESDNGLPALFSDRAGAASILNPFNADSEGFAAFHVVGGVYKITVTSGAFSRTWRYVGIGTAQEFDVEQLSITDANLTDMPEATVKGRPFGAGTGDPSNLNGSALFDVLKTGGAPLFGPGQSVVIATTPITLGVADSGKLFANFNFTSVVRLPPPGSARGVCYGFVHIGSGALTVDSLGNFLNFPDGTFASSVVLSGGSQSFILTNDGGAWYAFGSSIKQRQATTSVDGTVEFATAAEYRSNAANRGLNVDEVWASAGLVGLTDAATIGVDFGAGYNFSVTLGGNRTLGNPGSVKTGQSGAIVINQDGTGGRTLAYGNNWEFVGGVAPTLSTPPNTKDILFYYAQSSTSIIGTGLAKGVV